LKASAHLEPAGKRVFLKGEVTESPLQNLQRGRNKDALKSGQRQASAGARTFS
jgi:hypothetical protein